MGPNEPQYKGWVSNEPQYKGGFQREPWFPCLVPLLACLIISTHQYIYALHNLQILAVYHLTKYEIAICPDTPHNNL